MIGIFYDPTHAVNGRAPIMQIMTAPLRSFELDDRPYLVVTEWDRDHTAKNYVDVSVTPPVVRPCDAVEAVWTPATRALAPLPTPCTVSVDGSHYDCTDGSAELPEFPPGTYQIMVRAVGYLTFNYTLEVP